MSQMFCGVNFEPVKLGGALGAISHNSRDSVRSGSAGIYKELESYTFFDGEQFRNNEKGIFDRVKARLTYNFEQKDSAHRAKYGKKIHAQSKPYILGTIYLSNCPEARSLSPENWFEKVSQINKELQERHGFTPVTVSVHLDEITPHAQVIYDALNDDGDGLRNRANKKNKILGEWMSEAQNIVEHQFADMGFVRGENRLGIDRGDPRHRVRTQIDTLRGIEEGIEAGQAYNQKIKEEAEEAEKRKLESEAEEQEVKERLQQLRIEEAHTKAEIDALREFRAKLVKENQKIIADSAARKEEIRKYDHQVKELIAEKKRAQLEIKTLRERLKSALAVLNAIPRPSPPVPYLIGAGYRELCSWVKTKRKPLLTENLSLIPHDSGGLSVRIRGAILHGNPPIQYVVERLGGEKMLASALDELYKVQAVEGKREQPTVKTSDSAQEVVEQTISSLTQAIDDDDDGLSLH